MPYVRQDRIANRITVFLLREREEENCLLSPFFFPPFICLVSLVACLYRYHRALALYWGRVASGTQTRLQIGRQSTYAWDNSSDGGAPLGQKGGRKEGEKVHRSFQRTKANAILFCACLRFFFSFLKKKISTADLDLNSQA